jgi:phosphoglycerate dehydrogenase-like enzyme
MSARKLTIWCNAKFNETATQALIAGTSAHRLVWAATSSASVLDAGGEDPALVAADVAFGQPNFQQCMSLPALKWIEVTTAGYTRYDREDFREEIRRRGGVFTNASSVFAEPCAQHGLAMILALGRQLLPAYRDQLTDHSWHFLERRRESRLLAGETVLMLGFGAIGFASRFTPCAAAFIARAACTLFRRRNSAP